MRALLALLTLAVAGCGQTGSLYLPDESVESPVEIRTAPAPQAPPADDDEKDDEPAEPPGG
jgi:predicted small lipoprotein YifL